MTIKAVSLYDILKARREGGSVERCHTMPHHGEYNVAMHSYNVAQIIRTFHSSPSLELIGAALDHDVAERWTGDTPATAKWLSYGLKKELAVAEEVVEEHFNLSVCLTQEERRWLKAADLLEVWLWALEQQGMGNTNAYNIRYNVYQYLEGKEEELLPPPLLDLYRNWNAGRLSDSLPI